MNKTDEWVELLIEVTQDERIKIEEFVSERDFDSKCDLQFQKRFISFMMREIEYKSREGKINQILK